MKSPDENRRFDEALALPLALLLVPNREGTRLAGTAEGKNDATSRMRRALQSQYK